MATARRVRITCASGPVIGDRHQHRSLTQLDPVKMDHQIPVEHMIPMGEMRRVGAKRMIRDHGLVPVS
jgi:hypothetical protein